MNTRTMAAALGLLTALSACGEDAARAPTEGLPVAGSSVPDISLGEGATDALERGLPIGLRDPLARPSLRDAERWSAPTFDPPGSADGLTPRGPCAHVAAHPLLSEPVTLVEGADAASFGIAARRGHTAVVHPVDLGTAGDGLELLLIKRGQAPKSVAIPPVKDGNAWRVSGAPRVLVRDDGWLVATVRRTSWSTQPARTSDGVGVFVSRIAASGRTVTPQDEVAEGWLEDPELRFVSGHGGGALVTWTARAEGGHAVFGRALDADGKPMGPAVQLTEPEPIAAFGHDLVRTWDGYAVAWRTLHTWTRTSRAVAVRFFNADLHHLGDPRLVHPWWTPLRTPVSAAFIGGRVAVLAAERDTAGDTRAAIWLVPHQGFESQARRFRAEPEATLVSTGTGLLLNDGFAGTYLTFEADPLVGPDSYPGEGGARKVAWDGERFAFLWTRERKDGPPEVRFADGRLYCYRELWRRPGRLPDLSRGPTK